MAKQQVYVLVGMPRAGVPALTAGLEEHRESLAVAGVHVPSTSADEMFRAAVEIRREHRAWGLRRRDVEGAWARVARRATHKPRKHAIAVLGHDLLAGATTDQVALLVDALAGTAVHVVVTATAPHPLAGLVPGELDLGDVLERWSGAVRSVERVHVLVADPDDTSVAWRRLGEVIGVDLSGLPVPDAPGTTTDLDVGTLRLLGDATYAVLDHHDLVDLAEHWAKRIADRGYDVHGDLTALVPTRDARPTDPSRAVEAGRVEVLREALVDALAEVGRLKDRLDRGTRSDRSMVVEPRV